MYTYHNETLTGRFFIALGNVLNNRLLLTALGVGTVVASYAQAYGF